jgi:uncharacterized protein YndB with AHSA1/START domain
VVQIEIERTIAAPPGALWTYLSTAKGLSTWHADEVRGELASGEFLARYPSLGAELKLKVHAVDAGTQITLGAGPSRVEIRLEAAGDMGSRVQITHRGLDDDDDLDGFRASWALALGLLDLSATRHAGKTRSVRWFFGRARVPAALVHYYFSSQMGLAEWLGSSSGDLGHRGSRVRLRLEGDLELTGEVLCHEPGRDVCISWREQNDAALILRTLPGEPDVRQLAISVSSFDEPKLAPLAATALERALVRLETRLRKTFTT